jgi:hypothetical protein
MTAFQMLFFSTSAELLILFTYLIRGSSGGNGHMSSAGFGVAQPADIKRTMRYKDR